MSKSWTQMTKDFVKSVHKTTDKVLQHSGINSTFTCPSCNNLLKAKADQVVQCPFCTVLVQAPGATVSQAKSASHSTSRLLNQVGVKSTPTSYPVGKLYTQAVTAVPMHPSVTPGVVHSAPMSSAPPVSTMHAAPVMGQVHTAPSAINPASNDFKSAK